MFFFIDFVKLLFEVLITYQLCNELASSAQNLIKIDQAVIHNFMIIVRNMRSASYVPFK